MIEKLRRKPRKNSINCATCRRWKGQGAFPPCNFICHLTTKQQKALGIQNANGNYPCKYWKDMFPSWMERHQNFIKYVSSGFFVVLGYLLAKLPF